MRISSRLWVALLAAGVLPACVQVTGGVEAIEEDVVYLASDALEGRATGSEGASQAAEYIARRFEGLGLVPMGDDGGWYQPFDFEFRPNPHSEDGIPTNGKNVVGYLDKSASKTAIVGAHYDHLGFGGPGSRAPGDSSIHNGADDNASGVAALFEIASQLSSGDLDQNVLFLAFSGEERGLIGSKHYADNPTVDLDAVNFMINLDMIGRLKPDSTLVVGGVGTSPNWIPLLEELGAGTFNLKLDSSGVGPSDHTSFYLKDKPVLHFFTGQHQDYHKPEDDSHLINFDGILSISTLVADIVTRTADADPLAFSKTRDRQQGRQMARFKVSLGVMPDYTYDGGDGMRVDAVLDGRAGATAGMQGGDVIVRIGETSVSDIYSYMDALSKFEVGDEAELVVTRDGEEISTTVTF